MDVILLKHMDNLGQIGETVGVARGYARNFLIPRGLAVEASESAARAVADKIRLEQKRDLKRKAAAEALAKQYAEKDLSLTISVQAGEEGQLYGSVSKRDILDALAAKDIELAPRNVTLGEPIKQLGEFEIPVRLHPEVEIAVKVSVVRAE